MRKIKRCLGLGIAIILLMLPVACTAAKSATPPAASAPATAPTATTAAATAPAASGPTVSPEDRADKLFTEGMSQAQSGQFAEALATMAKAKKLAGDDPRIVQAHRLLEEYVSHASKVEARRAAEYAAAVERVQWARLTEQYARDHADVEAKLREKIHQIATALRDSGNSETLQEAAKDSYEQLQRASVKTLDDATRDIHQAVALLGKDKAPYGDVFRRVAATLGEKLEAYKQLWAKANVGDPNVRHDTARRLRAIEDGLYDDLGDLEGLTSEKPWSEAIMRALMAQRAAAPADKIAEQPWYRQLLQETEEHAKQFEAAGEWENALMAYTGLKELDETNPAYLERVKSVQPHIRVLRFYGPEEPAKPSATSRPKDLEPTWQELDEGIDAEMAQKVISQLDSYYVTAVDYAKLTRAALSSVKVLAETPQLAETFPGLADAAKRKAFLEDIDAQIKAVDARDRADHLDLALALNSVLRSSQRTVNIPVPVLAAEFTEGFLGELDEFSSMIWPHDMADFQKQTMGYFYGVGVQIGKEQGEPLRVVTPLANSPAFKAGLKAGDLILTVDGRPTEDIGVDKLVRMITGEKGTKVTLRIKRAGRSEPFDVTLTRQEINIDTVRGWQNRPDGQWDYLIDPADGVAYVRIMQFTEQTPKEFDQVLDALRKAHVHSLVLDLRFNPGGLLHSATEVADEFLSHGRLVATEGRQTRRQEINATPSGKYLNGDLVVLINPVSASAAEIVSGALKDWHRGVILGQRSYGKGSVQNVIPIRRGRAALKLTTAYYYLPSGRLLHRRPGQKDWGVDPDIEVRMTPKQTRQWLELRQRTDLLQDVDPNELHSDLARQYDADNQLAAAVLLLKLKQLQEPPEPIAPPASVAAATAAP
ncbi:MAG: S41 family peptidase [Phycisphaerae bacterium]